MSGGTEILLAVFNGEKYLAEQLDSLLAQTDHDWSLLARDDGSTDRSVEVLGRYRRRFPGKIRLLDAPSPHPGAPGNYAALLEASSAAHVMFCDQDDVWLPGKIAVTRAKMLALERAWGTGVPLLVHTDMSVVDAGLGVVAESFWRYQKIAPGPGSSLNRLLSQNCATGCATMVNRALCDLALPIPPEAVMHDHWLALVAAAFGRIGHLPEPTLLYRQHGGNDTGAKRWSLARTLWQLVEPESRRRVSVERRGIAGRLRSQARAFASRYASRLPAAHQEMLEAFVHLSELPYALGRWQIVKHGFWYTGLVRNVGRILVR